MMSRDSELGDVIVEFVRNGAYLKCSAIHVASGREVSALGPASDLKGVDRKSVV